MAGVARERLKRLSLPDRDSPELAAAGGRGREMADERAQGVPCGEVCAARALLMLLLCCCAAAPFPSPVSGCGSGTALLLHLLRRR